MRRAFRLAALSAAMLCAVSSASPVSEEQGDRRMTFHRQLSENAEMDGTYRALQDEVVEEPSPVSEPDVLPIITTTSAFEQPIPVEAPVMEIAYSAAPVETAPLPVLEMPVAPLPPFPPVVPEPLPLPLPTPPAYQPPVVTHTIAPVKPTEAPKPPKATEAPKYTAAPVKPTPKPTSHPSNGEHKGWVGTPGNNVNMGNQHGNSVAAKAAAAAKHTPKPSTTATVHGTPKPTVRGTPKPTIKSTPKPSVPGTAYPNKRDMQEDYEHPTPMHSQPIKVVEPPKHTEAPIKPTEAPKHTAAPVKPTEAPKPKPTEAPKYTATSVKATPAPTSVHPGEANGNKGGNGQHKGWEANAMSSTPKPTHMPRGKSAQAKARQAARHTPKPTLHATPYPKREVQYEQPIPMKPLKPTQAPVLITTIPPVKPTEAPKHTAAPIKPTEAPKHTAAPVKPTEAPKPPKPTEAPKYTATTIKPTEAPKVAGLFSNQGEHKGWVGTPGNNVNMGNQHGNSAQAQAQAAAKHTPKPSTTATVHGTPKPTVPTTKYPKW